MFALTFRARLFGSFFAVLAIGLALAGLSAWNITRLGNSLQIAVSSTAVKLDLVNAMRFRSQEMLASQRAVLLAWSANGDARTHIAKFQKASSRIHEQIGEVRPLLTTPAGVENLAGIEASVKEWEREAQAFFGSAAGTVTPESSKAYQEKTEQLGGEIEKRGTSIIAQLREFLAKDRVEAAEIRSFANAMNIILPLILFGVGIAALWVVNSTSRQLQRDIRTVSEAARTLTSAASSLASASQSLAQSSSEQAASIEETSAASEEVRAMADQNVTQSQESVADMHKASELVSKAAASLEHLTGWLKTLTDSSRNISRIIRVIDEIAFQTNILALNAAVEAARAGESGMGFAVVADEVRNLAQRCAQAASETSGLIEDTIRQSSAGKTRLEEMTAVIQALTPVADATRQRVEHVRQASVEQTKGINQINTTMGHLNQATQAVAANAEESAAASEEIYAQAHSLDDVAGALRALAG